MSTCRNPKERGKPPQPLDFWREPFEHVPVLSHKSQRATALLRQCECGNTGLNPHYAAFFECFNRQLFFEAHDVLEELWLQERGTPRDRFYRGLIQVAGAFVHLQKKRTQPASALLELARANLRPYLPLKDRLDVAAVIQQIDGWLLHLHNPSHEDLLKPGAAPKMELLSASAAGLGLPPRTVATSGSPHKPPGAPPLRKS